MTGTVSNNMDTKKTDPLSGESGSYMNVDNYEFSIDDSTNLPDVLLEAIRKTQSTVGNLVQSPPLSIKLLARPPVRYLKDIFCAIQETPQAKGFANGLFTEKELQNCCQSRESKYLFLTGLITLVAASTDNKKLLSDLRVPKVAAGREPIKTNKLLQELAKAVESSNSHRWEIAVEKAKVKIYSVLSKIQAIKLPTILHTLFYQINQDSIVLQNGFNKPCIPPPKKNMSDDWSPFSNSASPRMKSFMARTPIPGNRRRTCDGVEGENAISMVNLPDSLYDMLQCALLKSKNVGYSLQEFINVLISNEVDSSQIMDFLNTHVIPNGEDKKVFSRVQRIRTIKSDTCSERREASRDSVDTLSLFSPERLKYEIQDPNNNENSQSESDQNKVDDQRGWTEGRKIRRLKTEQVPAEPQSPSLINSKQVSHIKRLYQSIATFATEHVEGEPQGVYDISEEILGGGTFGFVQKVTHEVSKKIYAMKTVPKLYFEESGLWQEIQIQRQIDYPQIARLYHTFEDPKRMYIVGELCDAGELFEAMVNWEYFTESAVYHLGSQMCRTLSYLHGQKICHRDLKPENWLFSRPVEDLHNAELKLIDFGTAIDFSKRAMTTKICTLQYVAPDILQKSTNEYSELCDVWSLGVIFYQMYCGNLPFTGDTDRQVIKKIKSGIYTYDPPEIWQDISSEGKMLIRKMLEVDVTIRWTAVQCTEMIVQHTFTDGVMISDEYLENMLHFHTLPLLKQMALQMIVHQLDCTVLTEYRDCFLLLDTKYNGKVDLQLLQTLTEASFMEEEKKKDLLNLIETWKIGENPHSYTYFITSIMDQNIMDVQQCDKNNYISDTCAVRGAFVTLDVDGDGIIDAEELALFLLKDENCVHKALSLIEEITNTATMNFDEFQKMLLHVE